MLVLRERYLPPCLWTISWTFALEAAQALVMIGDQNIPWFSPLGHGTPEQRLLAAEIGFVDGPAACESAEFFALFPEEGQEHPGLE